MFSLKPALCLVVFATIILAPAVYGQSPQPASSQPVPVVIELFTSEGCSSCPPADVLLKRLDEFQPVQGAQLIVLSEHVTYWDHDGWKDPNSSSAFTERQSSYEGGLGEKEVFTPQLIVDGSVQLRMDQPQQMEGLLIKAKDDPKIPVRIAEVQTDASHPGILRTHVETEMNSTKHGADVFLAVALDHVESQVLRGENGGKHLEHVAVVRQLLKIGKLPKGKGFAQDIEVKLQPGEDPKNLRLVAFVQESGTGHLLGAAERKLAN